MDRNLIIGAIDMVDEKIMKKQNLKIRLSNIHTSPRNSTQNSAHENHEGHIHIESAIVEKKYQIKYKKLINAFTKIKMIRMIFKLKKDTTAFVKMYQESIYVRDVLRNDKKFKK